MQRSRIYSMTGVVIARSIPRLVTFALIILGIIQKNRRGSDVG
jgi:hypothetical protein